MLTAEHGRFFIGCGHRQKCEPTILSGQDAWFFVVPTYKLTARNFRKRFFNMSHLENGRRPEAIVNFVGLMTQLQSSFEYDIELKLSHVKWLFSNYQSLDQVVNFHGSIVVFQISELLEKAQIAKLSEMTQRGPLLAGI